MAYYVDESPNQKPKGEIPILPDATVEEEKVDKKYGYGFKYTYNTASSISTIAGSGGNAGTVENIVLAANTELDRAHWMQNLTRLIQESAIYLLESNISILPESTVLAPAPAAKSSLSSFGLKAPAAKPATQAIKKYCILTDETLTIHADKAQLTTVDGLVNINNMTRIDRMDDQGKIIGLTDSDAKATKCVMQFTGTTEYNAWKNRLTKLIKGDTSSATPAAAPTTSASSTSNPLASKTGKTNALSSAADRRSQKLNGDSKAASASTSAASTAGSSSTSNPLAAAKASSAATKPTASNLQNMAVFGLDADDDDDDDDYYNTAPAKVAASANPAPPAAKPAPPVAKPAAATSTYAVFGVGGDDDDDDDSVAAASAAFLSQAPAQPQPPAPKPPAPSTAKSGGLTGVFGVGAGDDDDDDDDAGYGINPAAKANPAPAAAPAASSGSTVKPATVSKTMLKFKSKLAASKASKTGSSAAPDNDDNDTQPAATSTAAPVPAPAPPSSVTSSANPLQAAKAANSSTNPLLAAKAAAATAPVPSGPPAGVLPPPPKPQQPQTQPAPQPVASSGGSAMSKLWGSMGTGDDSDEDYSGMLMPTIPTSAPAPAPAAPAPPQPQPPKPAQAVPQAPSQPQQQPQPDPPSQVVPPPPPQPAPPMRRRQSMPPPGAAPSAAMVAYQQQQQQAVTQAQQHAPDPYNAPARDDPDDNDDGNLRGSIADAVGGSSRPFSFSASASTMPFGAGFDHDDEDDDEDYSGHVPFGAAPAKKIQHFTGPSPVPAETHNRAPQLPYQQQQQVNPLANRIQSQGSVAASSSSSTTGNIDTFYVQQPQAQQHGAKVQAVPMHPNARGSAASTANPAPAVSASTPTESVVTLANYLNAPFPKKTSEMLEALLMRPTAEFLTETSTIVKDCEKKLDVLVKSQAQRQLVSNNSTSPSPALSGAFMSFESIEEFLAASQEVRMQRQAYYQSQSQGNVSAYQQLLEEKEQIVRLLQHLKETENAAMVKLQEEETRAIRQIQQEAERYKQSVALAENELRMIAQRHEEEFHKRIDMISQAKDYLFQQEKSLQRVRNTMMRDVTVIAKEVAEQFQVLQADKKRVLKQRFALDKALQDLNVNGGNLNASGRGQNQVQSQPPQVPAQHAPHQASGPYYGQDPYYYPPQSAAPYYPPQPQQQPVPSGQRYASPSSLARTGPNPAASRGYNHSPTRAAPYGSPQYAANPHPQHGHPGYPPHQGYAPPHYPPQALSSSQRPQTPGNASQQRMGRSGPPPGQYPYGPPPGQYPQPGYPAAPHGHYPPHYPPQPQYAEDYDQGGGNEDTLTEDVFSQVTGPSTGPLANGRPQSRGLSVGAGAAPHGRNKSPGPMYGAQRGHPQAGATGRQQPPPQSQYNGRPTSAPPVRPGAQPVRNGGTGQRR